MTSEQREGLAPSEPGREPSIAPTTAKPANELDSAESDYSIYYMLPGQALLCSVRTGRAVPLPENMDEDHDLHANKSGMVLVSSMSLNSTTSVARLNLGAAVCFNLHMTVCVCVCARFPPQVACLSRRASHDSDSVLQVEQAYGKGQEESSAAARLHVTGSPCAGDRVAFCVHRFQKLLLLPLFESLNGNNSGHMCGVLRSSKLL